MWLGCLDSNQGMQESKSCALPTWLHPKQMAEPTRFELAISGVTGRRVNQTTPRLRIKWCGRRDLNPYRINSYKALNLARLPIPPLPLLQWNGADDRSRTGDPFLTMEVLCLLSYIGPLMMLRDKWSGRRDSNSQPSRWQRDALPIELLPHGGRNRARTCDPLLVRQVLSQLSYSPWVFFVWSGQFQSIPGVFADVNRLLRKNSPFCPEGICQSLLWPKFFHVPNKGVWSPDEKYRQ